MVHKQYNYIVQCSFLLYSPVQEIIIYYMVQYFHRAADAICEQ